MGQQECEELESDRISFKIEKLKKSITIVIIMQFWVFAFLFGFMPQARMNCDPNLFAEQLIVLLQGLLLVDELNELFLKGSQECSGFLESFGVTGFVPPKFWGVESGNNFYVTNRVPFFSSFFGGMQL